MIPELGLLCLIQSFTFASLSVLLLTISLVYRRAAFLQSFGNYLVYGQCLFVVLSFLTLIIAFLTNDFSVSYVAHNSNHHLPMIYKLCAVWGAHEGSLLLWALILSGWMFAFTFTSKKLPLYVRSCVIAILSTIQFGFLILILETSNPFLRYLPFAPEEGGDLNPLLQDPGFVIHPPILYLGYVGLALPFAFAVTGMIYQAEKLPWENWARSWSLLAWAFLTLGITLGSWWAYYELGWGGWWFWDPVENASLMPWLIAAALIHALYTSKKGSMYTQWSILLCLSSFILSLIGTFLVRSGLLSSVHAFASDPKRGTYILIFLSLVIFLSLGLYLCRIRFQENRMRSKILSKESLLLFSNIIFFVATFSILLGTLYPLAYEIFYGKPLSVGPPYFNMVFIPIMIPSLIIMVLAPHVQWQNDTFYQVIKKTKFIWLLVPVGLIFALVRLEKIGFLSQVGVLLAFGIIISAILKYFVSKSFNWQGVGMSLAHAGLGIALVGISLAPLQIEKEFKMGVGESTFVSHFNFVLNKIQDIKEENFEGKEAQFIVKDENKTIAQLYPQKRYYHARGVTTTESAISAGILRDIYIALGEQFEDGAWSVRIYIKPFVRWIWFGGCLIALGALISSMISFKTYVNPRGV